VVVLIITGFARGLGATWSGLLSPFPVFASVMAVFSHVQGGASAAHRLLLGCLVGCFSSAAFLFVVAAMLPGHALVPTYTAAACLAVLLNRLSAALLPKSRG
jgi:hypothetical protein